MGLGIGMLRNSVGARAFAIILVVSLGCVLLFSAILFDVGYRAKKAAVDRAVQDLQTAEAEGLAEGLWDYDTTLLKALADGIRNYPYVNYVSIGDGRNVLVTSGADRPGSLVQSYPISRRQAGGRCPGWAPSRSRSIRARSCGTWWPKPFRR